MEMKFVPDGTTAMRYFSLCVAGILAGCALQPSHAQEPSTNGLRVGLADASLVESAQRLYLRAVDPIGASVLDLRADEIRVLEDGVEREVRSVRIANLPVHLVVLVDNSRGGRATRGVGGQRLLHYRAALAGLVERLPQNQLVSILPLAGEPRWLLRPSIDPVEIQRRVAEVSPGRDGLHLLDALDETAREIEESNELARPVVVIVTAVARERSRVTQDRYERVVDRFLRHGVTVHAVVVTGQRTGSIGDDLVSRVCAELAALTGGHHRRVYRTNHVVDQLVATADSIRRRNRELSRQLIVRYDRPRNAPAAEDVGVVIARRGLRWDLTGDGRIR